MQELIDGKITNDEFMRMSAAQRARAHPEAGGRQEALDGHREATFLRIRARCATPERDACPRRCWVLSGRRSVLNKTSPQQERTEADLDHAIRQIVSQAVASTEVLDIFEAARLKKPDISILSDQFRAEVHELPQKNLALELLKKLLLGEIKTRSRRNVVQAPAYEDS
jgi:hypothetical protein